MPSRHAVSFDQTSACLRRQARAVRDGRFGPRVFVRGVVEVSSPCRQNCLVCAVRRDNDAQDRYRLAADELAELISHHPPAAITDIDLQAGEDPVAVLELVLSLEGEARGDCYVIKIESSDAGHYQSAAHRGRWADASQPFAISPARAGKYRRNSSCDSPARCRRTWSEHWICWPSFRWPVAASVPSLPAGICSLPVHPMATSSRRWIVWHGCDSARRTGSSPAVSAMRLVSGNGYVRAFHAGANLATINHTALAARADYPIYKRDRIIMDEEHVLPAIAAAGCGPSRFGIEEHLGRKNRLATRREPHSSEAPSRAFEVARSGPCL